MSPVEVTHSIKSITSIIFLERESSNDLIKFFTTWELFHFHIFLHINLLLGWFSLWSLWMKSISLCWIVFNDKALFSRLSESNVIMDESGDSFNWISIEVHHTTDNQIASWYVSNKWSLAFSINSILETCSAEIKGLLGPTQGPWISERKDFFVGKLRIPGSSKMLKVKI